jgi:hypothetical protein
MQTKKKIVKVLTFHYVEYSKSFEISGEIYFIEFDTTAL